MKPFTTWLATVLLTYATLAAPVRDKHVEASLLSEVSAIQPGQPFMVALRLSHDEHWHTYWINDGDSGLPTTISWQLPEGFTAGPIQWPHPQRLPMPPLMSFGYEGEALLLVEITPPAELPAGEVTLNARVSWLMCKEICIPGKANLSLTLPVGTAASSDPAITATFAAARRSLPATETDWTFSLRVEPADLVIAARPPAPGAALTRLEIFPLEKNILANSAEPRIEATSGGYTIRIARESGTEAPSALRAVLVAEPTLARDTTRPAIEVEIGAASISATETGPPGAAAPTRSLLVISLFAFAGGLILNLMPCVFPVISLKILGFVKQAGDHPRAVWHHGLLFASGVVVSFWILAGLLLALRAGGANIGWGFQLQSPGVLIALSLLFFTLALNLFGIFEVGMSLTSAGGAANSDTGWIGSVLSGALATVIATPCTAPFMGVALGYALTQPPVVAMTVFTALALGMAFPYLVLSRYPALLKKLPRPGPWMETMKQAMGFLLLATVLWLLWVLAALTGAITLMNVLAGFLLIGISAWVLGKWDTLVRETSVRWRARLIGVVLLGAAVGVSYAQVEAAGPSEASANSAWLRFSPENMEEWKTGGKPVFIDFTAKWCLTCQVNKLTVLRTDEVMAAFRERGVILVEADWTDENEEIARELARFGRQSVPLYVLYDGRNAEPVMLPEILTRKIVLDALRNLD